MSGSFPTTVAISGFKMGADEKVHYSESISGVRQSRYIGAHRWVVSIEVPVMTKPEFRELWAFLVGQQGPLESFTLTIPESAQGALNGSPTFSSKTNDTTIVTAGWTNSITNQVKAGDFFTIENDPKVYMVTSDASSNGSGQVTIQFHPPLRTNPFSGDTIDFTDVSISVALDSMASYSRIGGLYQIEGIKLREVL